MCLITILLVCLCVGLKQMNFFFWISLKGLAVRSIILRDLMNSLEFLFFVNICWIVCIRVCNVRLLRLGAINLKLLKGLRWTLLQPSRLCLYRLGHLVRLRLDLPVVICTFLTGEGLVWLLLEWGSVYGFNFLGCLWQLVLIYFIRLHLECFWKILWWLVLTQNVFKLFDESSDLKVDYLRVLLLSNLLVDLADCLVYQRDHTDQVCFTQHRLLHVYFELFISESEFIVIVMLRVKLCD